MTSCRFSRSNDSIMSIYSSGWPRGYPALRRKRKESKATVKILCRILGIRTDAAYFKKETGVVRFTVEEAMALAGYFGCTVEELFGKEDEIMNAEENYNLFVAELEQLSAKYGIVVQSVGGVTIHEKPLTKVVYDRDYTSGDLIAQVIE